jgi:DNA-binding NarL/FixJ family response regulator
MSQPFDVATLIPSGRDFLQAVRTGRKGLALVPCIAKEEAGREALRMAESGVTAIAMREPSPAMAEAAKATRLPMLSLELVTTREGALSARAFGADGVLVDPTESAEATAAHARSTRMVALPLARTRADVERAVSAGAKALVVQAADAKGLVELASAAGRAIVIAWPTGPLADELQTLRGKVDAVIVDVDVYGATGFEALVSEVNP